MIDITHQSNHRRQIPTLLPPEVHAAILPQLQDHRQQQANLFSKVGLKLATRTLILVLWEQDDCRNSCRELRQAINCSKVRARLIAPVRFCHFALSFRRKHDIGMYKAAAAEILVRNPGKILSHPGLSASHKKMSGRASKKHVFRRATSDHA